MPIWAEFYYELVFGEPCTREVHELITGNANDVVTALKCCGLRHMRKRNDLTQFLMRKLATDALPHKLPEGLTRREQALYLQGVFFNTAVVQMSEAMTHLLMVVAQHPNVQTRIADNLADEHYLDQVMTETMRLYPLFGIAHRITSADIPVDERTTIPTGSVVCFNYLDYHRAGFEDPERFNPDRWAKLAIHGTNYIPFGVTANRPCPAHGLAPITMRIVTRELLRRFSFYTSAAHTRSIPNRGPCLLELRTQKSDRRLRRARLLFLSIRDRWEDVGRSFVQLTLGTFMVWDARRLRLCQRYFERTEENPI
jgi:hypothetical protein